MNLNGNLSKKSYILYTVVYFNVKDGYPIYGRYLDTDAPGYSVALDDCGGHIHSPDSSNLGYHYHSQVLTQTVAKSNIGLTAGQVYTAYINGPYKCKFNE